MIFSRPILHPLAADAIEKIRAAGVEPDPEEILWLQHTAENLTHPGGGLPDIIDLPVQVCNAVLWPLSVAGRFWFEWACATWVNSERCETLALAYAMAHGRNPDVLLACPRQPLAARWRVYWWAAGLSCSFRELNACVARTAGTDRIKYVNIKTPREEQGKPPPNPLEMGRIIALLMHHFGQTRQYWAFEVSESYLYQQISRLPEVLREDIDNAVNNSNMMRLVKNAIISAHKKPPSEPETVNREL